MGKGGAKAEVVFADRKVLPGGEILHMRILRAPAPVPPSEHGLKYSLFYGRPGERIVGYDNERGKGDHRHFGGHEEPYRFTTPERLVADFLADVRAAGGQV